MRACKHVNPRHVFLWSEMDEAQIDTLTVLIQPSTSITSLSLSLIIILFAQLQLVPNVINLNPLSLLHLLRLHCFSQFDLIPVTSLSPFLLVAPFHTHRLTPVPIINSLMKKLPKGQRTVFEHFTLISISHACFTV